MNEKPDAPFNQVLYLADVQSAMAGRIHTRCGVLPKGVEDKEMKRVRFQGNCEEKSADS